MDRYRTFSTSNAEYYLNYGKHTKETKIEKGIEEFDAIVLESGIHDYNECEYLSLYDDKQYKGIIAENGKLKEPRPIFLVDIPLKESIRKKKLESNFYIHIDMESWTYLLPIFLSVVYPYAWVFSLLFFISFYTGIFSNKRTGKYLSYFPLLGFYTSKVYRSAASAYKIEEFVAPEIRKRVGYKPKILIDYGAAHNDMEAYLKHKKLREFVINFHRKFSFLSFRDNSYLNKVCEFRHENSLRPSTDAKKKIIERKRDIHNFEKILYEI